jgi:hypothetical protein
MSPLLKERMYILTPEILVQGVMNGIATHNHENPLLSMGPQVAHDFIAWGLKKAFSDLTGYEVDSFANDPICSAFYSKFRFDFEHYMFGAIQDIGAHQLTGDLRYNLVLTYSRLYLIAF